jgi:hypothetical protein
MSTEPTTGHQEEGQSPDPNKVADAEKLFDKLFGKSEPANIVGETFTRKIVDGTDEHTFQRVVKGDDDNTGNVPDRYVATAKEVAVPPQHHQTAETSSLTNYPTTQDIATAVDAVSSDKVKAELLAQAKNAKYTAKPVIDFPARVSNIKTQNDKLRARLESLERQE